MHNKKGWYKNLHKKACAAPQRAQVMLAGPRFVQCVPGHVT